MPVNLLHTDTLSEQRVIDQIEIRREGTLHIRVRTGIQIRPDAFVDTEALQMIDFSVEQAATLFAMPVADVLASLPEGKRDAATLPLIEFIALLIHVHQPQG